LFPQSWMAKVMYFFAKCKVVHIYNMIIFHVPWIFEWWITIYNVSRKFIITQILYYILIIVQTYSKIMMNTKIQNQMDVNLFT
jgi:hypothetical protein